MSERMWLDEQLEKARTERDQARLDVEALRAQVAELRDVLSDVYPIGDSAFDNTVGFLRIGGYPQEVKLDPALDAWLRKRDAALEMSGGVK